MKFKFFAAAMLAATMLLAVTACGKTQSPDSSDKLNKDSSSHVDEVSEEEAWKTALSDDLFEKYGVRPEYYEDLGDGIYQVYVKLDGKVVPFVTVDSATGDYHG